MLQKPHAASLQKSMGDPECVVVLGTGLNMNKKSLNMPSRLLRKKVRADVIRVTLLGHHERGKLLDHEEISSDEWLDNMREAFDLAHERADKAKIPVHAFGFSTSAIAMLAAANKGLVNYDRAVLLSPAIRLHWWQQLKISAGLAWSKRVMKITTKTAIAEQIRSKDRIGPSAYAAMNDLKNSVLLDPHPERIKQPTLVMMNPDDTYVDFAGVKAFKDTHALDQWELYEVPPGLNRLDKFKHAIPHVLEVRRRIKEFLKR